MKLPIITEERADVFSFLLLIAGHVAGRLCLYCSVVLGQLTAAGLIGGIWVLLLLVFCVIRAKWIPISHPRNSGFAFGVANYYGSALLGGGVLIGVQILLGVEEFLFNQYWLLALVLSFIIGLLLHIWVATGVFWLVRRKWPKEQEAADETDRA